MDEVLGWCLIIVGCTLIITIGIVINEFYETDYDKCLDGCEYSQEFTDLENECNMDCNNKFAEAVGDEQ